MFSFEKALSSPTSSAPAAPVEDRSVATPTINGHMEHSAGTRRDSRDC